jgi:hypothetical protein
MFKDELKQYVADNPKLVTMKESTTMPGVFVLKYKKSVFYNNSWNDFLEHCRGSVVDKDFNLISYPFQKIYNYGIENRAPKLSDDTEVIAYRKVNGFMVACTWYNGDVLVSTTGSTDSPFVGLAKEMMLTHMSWADWQLAFASADMQGLTVMFECVHPDDPHISPEKTGMYVLGLRDNKWCSRIGHSPGVLEIMGTVFNCYVPEVYRVSLRELKQMTKECRHEGYVFYTQDGVSAKIKSPYYLTSKWVARNPNTDKLMTPQFREQIDEEYYGLLSHICENIVQYTAMNEQARLAWVRNYMEAA